MRRLTVIFLSIILCILTIISTIGFVSMAVLNTTILSADFYLEVSNSENYSTLVMNAIEEDVQAQSSYVGIPPEVLLKGLDTRILQRELNEYMVNTADYLKNKSGYVPVDFAPEFFLPALKEFLETDARSNDYIPSNEQYALLAEVSRDTAHIVKKHIDLFQLNMLKDAQFFNRVREALSRISKAELPALWLLLLSMSCLLLLHKRNLKKWLLYQFSAFWIAGSLLTVSMAVLEGYRLTRRIAIELPYLRYAVYTFLTNISTLLLYRGVLILLLASMGLILRIFKNYRFVDYC